jgi:alpha-1,6-mannosyltransferase
MSAKPPTSRNSSPPAESAALWPGLLVGALGGGLLALWFPLWPHVGRVPPADLRTFAPTLLAGLLYALVLLALHAFYLTAIGRVNRTGATLPAVLLGGLLLGLPLLLAYPINATDVYRYLIRGRVAAVYGQSPFVAPPAAFIGDPFLPLAGEWAGETSPYGPLWELVATGVAAVSGDNLLLGVTLFKLLALGCLLAGAAVIWAVIGERPGRAVAAALWAWNPALLLTFAMNGHNDALMLLWLLLGYLVMRRGRPALGFLLLCLAALTKPVAALALPVFFIAAWRGLPDGRARARFALVTIGGAAALTWLAFLPWAAPGRFWQTPFELIGRLLREATDSGGFSPAVWLYFALGQRVPIESIGAVLRGLFVALVGWVLWRGWRGRPAVRGAADMAFGYLAQALSFRIWYAVWPFPFLLLAQLSVVFYGHLRVAVWGGDHVPAHLIGVPLVFGLPWLLARWPLPGLTPRS